MFNLVLEIKDEIINGEPLYAIKDVNGNVLYNNCKIEMVTEILQQGTPLNKALFDKIQNVIDYMNSKEKGEDFLKFSIEGTVGRFDFSYTMFDV